MCPHATPELSIVIATHRRFARLKRCIERTRAGLAGAPAHEFVVIAAADDEGTVPWLAGQRDVRLEVEARRAGACRAYNAGFRLARGTFVCWLNDDAYALPGSIEAALAFIRDPRNADVGLVAFYHNHNQPWNELHGLERDGVRYGMLHVRGVPYANFGLLRRELLERVGYLDEGYYFCGWDPDLSLKVQREAGLLVLGCPEALVFHEELCDERKAADAGDVRTRDNERLFRKWNLAARGSYPDPRPAYERLRAARA